MNFFDDPSKIVVENRKVKDYLLNVAHSDAFGKANLFIRYGFRQDRPDDFINSVIAHAQNSQIVSEFKTPFGRKIIVEGNLETSIKKLLMIRSIWILSLESPLLVTRYPIKK